MSKITDFLNQAAHYSRRYDDNRTFFVGAIGIRKDGAKVMSRNSTAEMISPNLHAEAKLAKKLDVGAVVYVARFRKDWTWGNARPCRSCRAILRAKGVKKVYYTVGNGEYGMIDFSTFKEENKPTGRRLNQFDPLRWRRGES